MCNNSTSFTAGSITSSTCYTPIPYKCAYHINSANRQAVFNLIIFLTVHIYIYIYILVIDKHMGHTILFNKVILLLLCHAV